MLLKHELLFALRIATYHTIYLEVLTIQCIPILGFIHKTYRWAANTDIQGVGKLTVSFTFFSCQVKQPICPLAMFMGDELAFDHCHPIHPVD